MHLIHKFSSRAITLFPGEVVQGTYEYIPFGIRVCNPAEPGCYSYMNFEPAKHLSTLRLQMDLI